MGVRGMSPDAVSAADAAKRPLLTNYNGRAVLMLPRMSAQETAELTNKITSALHAAGIQLLVD